MVFSYLNGEFVTGDRACIPLRDRGVLLGDGLFETIRSYRGTPFGFHEHFQRLRDSAAVLQLEMTQDEDGLLGVVCELLQLNGLAGHDAPDGYIRITLTGGMQGAGFGLQRPGPPSLFIFAHRFEGFPEAWYRDGLTLVVSAVRRNAGSPATRMKTLNCLDSLLAREEANDAGAHEALMLDNAGRLAEASTSNLFFVFQERLCTPSLSCGALPGTTRQLVMDLCAQEGIKLSEGEFGLDELSLSSEVFLSNSLREIVPVREVEGIVRFTAVPGPLTARLSEAYRLLVDTGDRG